MDYSNKSKEEIVEEMQALQQENHFLRTFYEEKGKQTANQLKESEEKFRTIFSKSLSSMLIADDLGNYLAANEAASKLFGYSINELLRMNVCELITVSRPSASERYAEYIQKGEEIGEFDFVTNNGEPRIVQYQAIRLKPDFNLSIMMDITELKRIEEEQKINLKKLEILNKTKDKFFTIIAHDLRNPFFGIIRLSEFMETSLTVGNKEETENLKYIRLILNSAKTGFDLLENLMKWAKSQTGELDFNPTHISIKYLISQVIALINGNAVNKNITFDINFSESDVVYADESLSSTILRNLLSNAIKFTHPNGKITVSTKKKNKFLAVSIRDTGIGIDAKNLTKIFSIDSKFTNVGTNKETGTGLGLILCKEFVERQGGTIYATSKLGEGSEFTFTLPLPS